MSITLVNQAKNRVAGAQTSLTVTITLPTAGNFLVCCFGCQSGTGVISGITGGGVTWVKAQQSATNLDSEIWYGVNSTGIGTSVVISFASNSGPTAVVAEFSGIVGLDTSSSNNGSSTTPTTASITPTKNPNVLFIGTGVGTNGVYSSGPTNSWTDFTLPVSLLAGYFIGSSLSANSTGWTISSSVSWDTEIAAFIGTVYPAQTYADTTISSTIADTIKRAITVAKADTFSVIESLQGIIRHVFAMFTDHYTLVESFICAISVLWKEVLTLIETFRAGNSIITKVFHEVFTIFDRSVFSVLDIALTYFRQYLLDLRNIRIPLPRTQQPWVDQTNTDVRGSN